jgi:hypothetical protein
MLRSITILSTLLSAYGCSSTGKVTDPVDPVGTDSGDPIETDDTGTVDPVGPVDISLESGPCISQGWGGIAAPATALHVAGGAAAHQLDAALTSDGSPSHPFRSVTELLTHLDDADVGDKTTVGLWPGEFSLPAETLNVLSAKGLGLSACGADQTFLVPRGNGDAPLIRISDGASVQLNGLHLSTSGNNILIDISGATAVELSDLRLSGGPSAHLISAEDTPSVVLNNSVLEGGRTGVWTNGNATSITISNTQINGSSMAGVWTNGNATSLQGVTIANITGLPGITDSIGGWGLNVKQGLLVIHDLVIDGANQVGLYSAASVVNGSDITIRNIDPDSTGAHGRGAHISGTLYEDTSVTLSDITIEDVHDAGLFIRNAATVSLSNIVIDDVRPGRALTDEEDLDEEGPEVSTGDGIVIVQRGWVTEDLDPEMVNVTLTGSNHMSAVARAAIIVDAAVLNLEMPETLDAGLSTYGYSIFSQHCAILNWLDASDYPEYDSALDYLSFDSDDLGL